MNKRISSLCALSLSLTAVLVTVGLIVIAVAAFVPNAVLPALDLPALAALSLTALAVETLIFGHGSRRWAASFGAAALNFGLLTLCTGLMSLSASAQIAVLGGMVFLVCEALFHSILDRLSSGLMKRRQCPAVVLTALLLWLASQGLAGIGI